MRCSWLVLIGCVVWWGVRVTSGRPAEPKGLFPAPAIDVSAVNASDLPEGGFDRGPVSPALPPGNRVRARDVPAFVNKICDEAEDHPDAEFEISWRIVES